MILLSGRFWPICTRERLLPGRPAPPPDLYETWRVSAWSLGTNMVSDSVTAIFRTCPDYQSKASMPLICSNSALSSATFCGTVLDECRCLQGDINNIVELKSCIRQTGFNLVAKPLGELKEGSDFMFASLRTNCAAVMVLLRAANRCTWNDWKQLSYCLPTRGREDIYICMFDLNSLPPPHFATLPPGAYPAEPSATSAQLNQLRAGE